MSRIPPFISVLVVAVIVAPVLGDAGDCLWGGINEATSYTSSYIPGQGGETLAQLPQPPVNLGAPQPAVPVQATPNSQAINVPQANIPTVTIPAGDVGSVGRPATAPTGVPVVPPGTEIVYVMPATDTPNAVCIDGHKETPATETKVVPAGTPGAIPVALKTVTVRRQKIDYVWTYSPIVTKTDTMVNVVNPRTGKVVRSYCQQDESSTCLPYLHRKEVITYETVEAKVGTPISVAPTTSSTINTAVLGN
jgi:hypothetical protein